MLQAVGRIEPTGKDSDLTDEDRALLLLVARDWPNSAIAQLLEIPIAEVRHRLTELCERLGVSGREELKEVFRRH